MARMHSCISSVGMAGIPFAPVSSLRLTVPFSPLFSVRLRCTRPSCVAFDQEKMGKMEEKMRKMEDEMWKLRLQLLQSQEERIAMLKEEQDTLSKMFEMQMESFSVRLRLQRTMTNYLALTGRMNIPGLIEQVEELEEWDIDGLSSLPRNTKWERILATCPKLTECIRKSTGVPDVSQMANAINNIYGKIQPADSIFDGVEFFLRKGHALSSDEQKIMSCIRDFLMVSCKAQFLQRPGRGLDEGEREDPPLEV